MHETETSIARCTGKAVLITKGATTPEEADLFSREILLALGAYGSGIIDPITHAIVGTYKCQATCVTSPGCAPRLSGVCMEEKLQELVENGKLSSETKCVRPEDSKT